MKDIDIIKREHPAISILYNTVICVLAVVSIVIVIRSFVLEQTAAETNIDIVIWFVFVADYAGRFVLAKDKKQFFVRNIIDLIAIIPFYSVFQFFRIGRVVRVARLLRLVKFLRAGARIAMFIKRTRRFLNTNGFKYVISAVVAMVFVSSFLMMIIEKMSFLDGLWWSFVTVTTVGYGDISPATSAGRALAVVLMIFGIGLIGSLTSTVTAFFIRQHSDNQNEFVSAAISKLEDFDNLTKEDVEEISRVLIALKDKK